MAAVPVLKMGHLALVSIQVDMDDQLALGLQEDLSERILEWRATGVIIDISSLDIVDSFIGRVLANIAQIASMLDARTVVVGMQPAVAITMVELGIRLNGVKTALNLEKGVRLLEESAAEDEAAFANPQPEVPEDAAEPFVDSD
jgi:rsbT antagonist protein RsbS